MSRAYVLVGLYLFFYCISAKDVDASELETEFEVQVNQDYIDIRSGPGRAYPIHQIIQQDEYLKFVRQKTNWIYIKSAKGVEGWLHSSMLTNLKSSDGEDFRASVIDKQPLAKYFELGLSAGYFGGSQVLAGHGSYAFTPQISLETTLSEAIGSFSTTYAIGAQLMHFANSWKGIRPYGALGVGRVFLKASPRIQKPEDEQDDFLKAALGIRAHVDGRFYMKFEYGSYLVLRSQDNNDEINEWKLGISSIF